MKTNDDYFADWESSTFGYGYGTGELPILTVLSDFLHTHSHDYDYAVLEARYTPVVAWFLINILCRADIIEYGTSPRFGWLTEKGERLREYVISKSVEELVAQTSRDQDYTPCYPDHCNCNEQGINCKVQNPFWSK